MRMMERGAAAPHAEPPVPDAEQAERFSSLALFLVLTLLIGSFFTSYYLKVKRITAVHETIVGLFAGMFVGIVLRIGPMAPVREMLGFSNTIMLNVLLPPIILASGYELRQGKFFRNFGTIIAFALAGTFISAIVIGMVVWVWAKLGIESLHLSLLDCLIFGSTLSATDPVTILAIFNTYKVDPQLYSVIFGESLLNDAVSIVIFDTLTRFRDQDLHLATLFHALGLFLFVFSLSIMLGVCFGLACSLILKHSRIGTFPQLETCIVVLIAYSSYFFSNSVQMSGIVSLLFCGITLKHYAYHSMSLRTQRTTRAILHTLANLSENFIFIYLGLSLFTSEQLKYLPLLIIVTLAAVVLSRYASVFSIAGALNTVRRIRLERRQRGAGGASVPRLPLHLSREYQIMLFWAGLRGAVGFALSAGIEGQHARALQTTVLVAVVLTVIVFGGTTAQMLDILNIATGVQDDEDAESDEELDDPEYALGTSAGSSLPRTAPHTTPAGSYRDTDEAPGLTTGRLRSPGGFRDEDPEGAIAADQTTRDAGEVLPELGGLPNVMVASSGGLRSMTREELEQAMDDAAPTSEAGSTFSAQRAREVLQQANVIFQNGQWFQRIDERYLLPMFSNSVANRKYEQRRGALQARRAARDSGMLEGSLQAAPEDGSVEMDAEVSEEPAGGMANLGAEELAPRGASPRPKHKMP